jgi:hypothetical protein
MITHFFSGSRCWVSTIMNGRNWMICMAWRTINENLSFPIHARILNSMQLHRVEWTSPLHCDNNRFYLNINFLSFWVYSREFSRSESSTEDSRNNKIKSGWVDNGVWCGGERVAWVEMMMMIGSRDYHHCGTGRPVIFHVFLGESYDNERRKHYSQLSPPRIVNKNSLSVGRLSVSTHCWKKERRKVVNKRGSRANRGSCVLSPNEKLCSTGSFI